MRLIIPKIQSKVYIGELLKAAPALLSKKDRISEFEDSFSNVIGRKYCSATFSGRAGLLAVLASLGLKEGDEILLPAFTFIGIPQMIEASGFKPVFVDIDEDTLNMDLDGISKMVSKKSRALLLVHNLGNPNDMDKVLKICKKHDLILIEDCAHTVGSKYKGKLLGTFGRVSIFSFHYSKVMNTYWGGMTCTDDKALSEKINEAISKYKNQTNMMVVSRVMTSIAQAMVSIPIIYSTLFQLLNGVYKKVTGKDIIEALYKLKPQDPDVHRFKFSNFQAVIGLEQLKKLPKINANRLNLVSIFSKELKNKSIVLQKSLTDTKFIPLYIAFRTDKRDELVEYLKKNKIEIKTDYIPAIPLEHKEFSKFRYKSDTSKKVRESILYFQTYHLQSEKDIRYVASILNSFQ